VVFTRRGSGTQTQRAIKTKTICKRPNVRSAKYRHCQKIKRYGGGAALES